MTGPETSDKPVAVPTRFVARALPWLVGGTGFLVFLVTLNHWVSLYSLGMVARAQGGLWQPQLQRPLTSILLYLAGWLPKAWIPLFLNLASALGAALILVLLARSVAILRHDLSHDDPLRKPQGPSILSTPTAWIPPVLAAAVCGLQLSFWEHATSFTGEMVNLFIFAYAIRCLLEFRLDQDESWFSRCAILYGLGMANDWALVAYLPVLVAAMVWISGFQIIYNRRWLARTIGWGAAGASLYLLLPVVQSLSTQFDVGFWSALKANLKSQKDNLGLLRRQSLRALAFSSLLPIIVLSIRWKSHTLQFADDTRLGVFLTKFTVHFVHALFFGAAVWMALDPTFSPRHLDLGLPMLTYYYTLALVTGYCAGHFLLTGTGEVHRGFARLAVSIVYASVLVLPAVLAGKNWGQIRITNGPALREFAQRLYEDLPAGKSVAISDDPREVLLLQAEVARHGSGKDVIAVDASFLPFAGYHKFLARKFPTRWQPLTATNQASSLSPGKVLKIIASVAEKEPVVFLHPSSGFLFEGFQDRPNGLVRVFERDTGPRRAQERGTGVESNTNRFRSRKPDPAAMGAKSEVWEQRWAESLEKIPSQVSGGGKPSAWAGFLSRRLLIKHEQNFTLQFLAGIYSRALTDWGVQLQRQDRREEVWFARAIALNSDNVSARITELYNKRYREGDRTRLEAVFLKREFEDSFVRYNDWREILNANGPVDEPTVLFEMGKALMQNGNVRQGIASFQRCSELVPSWTEPRVWAALGLLDLRDFAGALESTRELATQAQAEDPNTLAKILFCRSLGLKGLGQTNESQAALVQFANEHRDRPDILATGVELFSQNSQFSCALVLLDQLLANDPANLRFLAKRGWVLIELGQYDAAIETLGTVVSRSPADENARLNLAIARLGAKQYDAAQTDYEQLLNLGKKSRNALFGLAGIAWQKHETNTAVNLYQQYLSNGIPDSAQYAVAAQRLKILTAEK